MGRTARGGPSKELRGPRPTLMDEEELAPRTGRLRGQAGGSLVWSTAGRAGR